MWRDAGRHKARLKARLKTDSVSRTRQSTVNSVYSRMSKSRGARYKLCAGRSPQ